MARRWKSRLVEEAALAQVRRGIEVVEVEHRLSLGAHEAGSGSGSDSTMGSGTNTGSTWRGATASG